MLQHRMRSSIPFADVPPVRWLSNMLSAPAASVLMLPYTAFTFLVRSGGPQPLPGSPLGDASRLLLLVLLHHAPPLEIGISNPFRAALQQLQVGTACSGSPATVNLLLANICVGRACMGQRQTRYKNAWKHSLADLFALQSKRQHAPGTGLMVASLVLRTRLDCHCNNSLAVACASRERTGGKAAIAA